MQVSNFRMVAVGRVDTNKPLTDTDGSLAKTIEVVPTEFMSFRDGELTSNPTPMTFSTTDMDGNAVQGKAVGDNTWTATWLPSGSNRLTAPDVRRGERVEIWQAADDDKYYWRTQGLDDHLRKLETIIFGISATKDEGDNAQNLNNMYWFEFSSHSKKLAFRSCKANGEPFLYEMFFDFDVGEFNIRDDIGNYIRLASALHLIHLENADGTFVELNRKDINAFAPNNINAKATNDVNINAGQNMNLIAGVKAMINGGGSVLTLQGGGTTLVTPDFAGTIG